MRARVLGGSILVGLSLVASASVLPLAAAAWSAKGQVEPDTRLDRDSGFTWHSADVSPGARGNRVYFNAFTVQNGGYGAHGLTVNPNSGALATQRQAWPGQMAALLGVWKDCNRDGFVGLGDNGLFEYRAELLLGDVGVCPVSDPGPVPPGAASHDYRATHNDGQWVREFLPLGPAARPAHLPDANPFDVNDNDARVWADWNGPGEAPPATRCNLVFVPAGTYSSTGGMLAYADCLTDFTVTDAWNAAVALAGGDDLGLGQLSFKDAPRDQGDSRSVLNRPNPWGRPGDAAFAEAFDCSGGQLARQKVPGTTHEVGVSRPRAPTANAGGSVAGTLNATATALDDCDRSDNEGEWEHAPGAAPYGLEDEGIRNGAGPRDVSDFPMAYSEGQRPAGVLTPQQLGRATPKDGGTRAYDSEGVWLSGTRVAEDRNPYVNRASARGGAAMPVQVVTAYAFVSGAAVSKHGLVLSPGGVTGKYGAEACGVGIGPGAPARGGWVCDPAQWSHACALTYTCLGTIAGRSDVDITVQVGQAYQLRDVDCYDGSAGALREQGVSWGVLTATGCL